MPCIRAVVKTDTDPEIRELLFAVDITPEEQRRLDRRFGDLADRCGLVATG